MQDTAVPIPGGSINVWYRAPGPGSITTVLLHGLTSTSRSFADLITALPTEVGVVAIDVRGRGQSWLAPGPYDLPTVSDDIPRALDHLELDKAVVTGHSMGAWIAALAASRHPDRVISAVLVDGGLPVEVDRSLTPEQVMDAAVGPAVQRLELEFDTPQAYLDWWRAHPSFVDTWPESMDDIRLYDIHEVDGKWVTRINKDAVWQAGGDTFLSEETETAWSRVGVPATIVTVERGMLNAPGGFIPSDLAEQSARANPNLSVTHIQDLNHYTVLHEHGAHTLAEVITS
ncbi:MAG: alpha/beta hydrolase [Acidimicrobiia bacterium]|nr:alpha/beta hydrolase [Acidimicrobiia bacterium]